MNYIKNKFGNYDVFTLITSIDIHYDITPIFFAIDNNYVHIIPDIIGFMIPYLDEYYQKYNREMLLNQSDMEHNTYLHRLLQLIINKILSIENESTKTMIRFFIKHTDLNQINYKGISCVELLFSENHIWKFFKDELKNKEIDISNINYKEDKEFIEFSKNIKQSIKAIDNEEIKKMFNIEDVKTFLNFKSKTYGLYHAGDYYYYFLYLEKKHKSLYFPIQKYSEQKKEDDMFFSDITSFNVSGVEWINNYYQINNNLYYSYSPLTIYWSNKTFYHIHHNLSDILIEHNKSIAKSDQRYIILYISIEDYIFRFRHANILLYDRLKKEIWYFEPSGKSNKYIDIEVLHKKIKKIFTHVYGKIIYHLPNSFLHDISFQVLSEPPNNNHNRVGDNGAYCMAWCIFFIDIVLSNPDKNVNDIMKKFITKDYMENILSEEYEEKILSDNYYRDFITIYSQKIDNEKNKILLEADIKKNRLYNLHMNEEETDIIKKLFIKL